MKTASDKLKEKNHIPTNTENNTTISQSGPEDGRDQNITPDSHSYAPKAGEAPNHNEEVSREGEAVNQFPNGKEWENRTDEEEPPHADPEQYSGADPDAVARTNEEVDERLKDK